MNPCQSQKFYNNMSNERIEKNIYSAMKIMQSNTMKQLIVQYMSQ